MATQGSPTIGFGQRGSLDNPMGSGQGGGGARQTYGRNLCTNPSMGWGPDDYYAARSSGTETNGVVNLKAQRPSGIEQWDTPLLGDKGLLVGGALYCQDHTFTMENFTPFNNNTNCTVALLASNLAYAGQYLSQVTSTAAATTTAGTGNTKTEYSKAWPGRAYTATAQVRAASTGRAASIGIAFYDSTDTVLAGPIFGTTVTDGTTGWVTITTGSIAAPSLTDHAKIFVRWTSTAAAEVHYVDQVRFYDTNADALGGFDATEDSYGVYYFWAQPNTTYTFSGHLRHAPDQLRDIGGAGLARTFNSYALRLSDPNNVVDFGDGVTYDPTISIGTVLTGGEYYAWTRHAVTYTTGPVVTAPLEVRFYGNKVQECAVQLPSARYITPLRTDDFEDGTTQSWAVFTGGATLANSTAQAHSGTRSLLATVTSTAALLLGPPSGTNGTYLRARGAYGFSATVWVRPSAGRQGRIRIHWYKADGTASATALSNTTYRTMTANAWNYFNLIVQPAPSDATYGQLYFESSDATAGDTFYVDDALFEYGTIDAGFESNDFDHSLDGSYYLWTQGYYASNTSLRQLSAYNIGSYWDGIQIEESSQPSSFIDGTQRGCLWWPASDDFRPYSNNIPGNSTTDWAANANTGAGTVTAQSLVGTGRWHSAGDSGLVGGPNGYPTKTPISGTYCIQNVAAANGARTRSNLAFNYFGPGTFVPPVGFIPPGYKGTVSVYARSVSGDTAFRLQIANADETNVKATVDVTLATTWKRYVLYVDNSAGAGYLDSQSSRILLAQVNPTLAATFQMAGVLLDIQPATTDPTKDGQFAADYVPSWPVDHEGWTPYHWRPGQDQGHVFEYFNALSHRSVRLSGSARQSDDISVGIPIFSGRIEDSTMSLGTIVRSLLIGIQGRDWRDIRFANDLYNGLGGSGHGNEGTQAITLFGDPNVDNSSYGFGIHGSELYGRIPTSATFRLRAGGHHDSNLTYEGSEFFAARASDGKAWSGGFPMLRSEDSSVFKVQTATVALSFTAATTASAVINWSPAFSGQPVLAATIVSSSGAAIRATVFITANAAGSCTVRVDLNAAATASIGVHVVALGN